MAKKIVNYKMPTVTPLKAVKNAGRHPLRHTVITATGGQQSNYIPCGLCGDVYSPKAQKRGTDWAFGLASCQNCSDNKNLAKAGLRRYVEFVAKYGHPVTASSASPGGYVKGGWNVRAGLQGLLPHYLTLMKYAHKYFNRRVRLVDLYDTCLNDPQLV